MVKDEGTPVHTDEPDKIDVEKANDNESRSVTDSKYFPNIMHMHSSRIGLKIGQGILHLLGQPIIPQHVVASINMFYSYLSLLHNYNEVLEGTL